ncbi:CPBP family intramembrane glutamic endopeptidase [Nocardioides terrigena]|uniref:CPBP family intramembrane glutamic endopeptidase n=1 Tax=Nocardioides terrigena TaxID=424797 RepID=UPI000D2F8572|nr:CPBP family intramembrane glutamic endopeptidase [Nocardioides terrigena]
MTADVTQTHAEGGLRGFLEKGGFWRLLLLVVVYLLLYIASGRVAGLLDPGYGDDDLLSSLGAVFFQLTVGLVFGAVILTALTSYMGWNAEIFDRQPIYRSGWMWIAPVLVAIPITLRVLDIDWGGPALSVVLLVMASGLMVGYVEELLYRGVAVKMLRAAGHREIGVAALSSLLFGLSHSINIFTGQAVTTVGSTMVYTFAFGALMYLTMRATGFIIWAMLLHGLTDPTGFLASGGIDKMPGSDGSSALADAVGLFTIAMIVIGIVLLLCVRGKVGEPREVKASA